MECGSIIMYGYNLSAISARLMMHMRTRLTPRLAWALCIGPVSLDARPAPAPIPNPAVAPGFAVPGMERIADGVYVAQIGPGLWVHTTVGKLDDSSLYAANGALVEDGNGSVLIDAGWTPAQAEALAHWAATTLKHPIVRAYVTHFHYDRVGGAAALERRHIPVYAIPLTIELDRTTHQPAVPDHALPVPTTPTSIARDALIFFPGAGHTRDNVVVYFPKERILFGGCFIKDSKATGMGNIADADLAAWPASLGRTEATFPQIATVIPGHGPMDPQALAPTRDLLKQTPAS
jgi:metallo-beta-lactamase class B